MEIGAAEYRRAAEEHLLAAYHCHREGVYVSSHYLSGLAVECILRAYRWRVDPSWDGRHVLHRLYKAARFDSVVPTSGISSFEESFALILDRWSNEHRYASPAKLERHLNEIRATINVRGSKLKLNSREMYDAAENVVGIGVSAWKN